MLGRTEGAGVGQHVVLPYLKTGGRMKSKGDRKPKRMLWA